MEISGAFKMSSTWKLKKLEEQITCPVCLGIYTEPKTLPCHHSFCLSCLEGILVTNPEEEIGGGRLITCPHCRSLSRVPGTGGLGSFTDAYHVSNLKKIHSLLSLKSETGGISKCSKCDKESQPLQHCSHCPVLLCEECSTEHRETPSLSHHELTPCSEIEKFETELFPSDNDGDGGKECCETHRKPLSLFCEDCSVYICKDCTRVDDGLHGSHHYEHISDSYHLTCQRLEASFNPLKSTLAKARHILSGQQEREVREQAENTTEEIHSMVEGLIALLRQSEEKMKKRVEGIIENKLKVISEQKRLAEESLAQLEGCQEYVETGITVNSPGEVLVSHKPMMDHIEEINSSDEALDPGPEKSDIKFVPRTNALQESISHLGYIVFSSHRMLPDCRVRIMSEQLERSYESVLFPLAIEYQDSVHVSAPLSVMQCSVLPLDDEEDSGEVETTLLTTATPGLYRVHCTPVTRGRVRVILTVSGIELEEASLVVPFHPSFDSEVPEDVIEGLESPNGITFTADGHIVISENSGFCLQVFDSKRKKVKSIGTSEGDTETFLHPRGLFSLPDNTFLILDDHKIRKMSLNGECLASVGQNGRELLEFSYPGGVTVSPNTGRIWITDYCNNRVQVLNPDFTFAFSIGELQEGSEDGKFRGPTCSVIDTHGLAYVADVNNHRIQIFKEDDGRFVSKFGSVGAGEGEFDRPVRLILVQDKFLYITEHGNHRVSVYTTQGEFVTCFGEDELYHPYGLEIDRNGYLYVCDSGNDRVIVY